jgi:hypothetical protein
MWKAALWPLELKQPRFVSRGFFALAALCAITLLFAGCHHELLVDTAPLDAAGMSYDAIQQAKTLKVTTAEVGELAKAKQGGLSDENAVKILQIFRTQGHPFTAGATVAGLIRAGLDEPTVVELANLNQLGFAAGELEAMRLAGLSDETIIEVARRHAEGKTVLSGASAVYPIRRRRQSLRCAAEERTTRKSSGILPAPEARIYSAGRRHLILPPA